MIKSSFTKKEELINKLEKDNKRKELSIEVLQFQAKQMEDELTKLWGIDLEEKCVDEFWLEDENER